MKCYVSHMQCQMEYSILILANIYNSTCNYFNQSFRQTYQIGIRGRIKMNMWKYNQPYALRCSPIMWSDQKSSLIEFTHMTCWGSTCKVIQANIYMQRTYHWLVHGDSTLHNKECDVWLGTNRINVLNKSCNRSQILVTIWIEEHMIVASLTCGLSVEPKGLAMCWGQSTMARYWKVYTTYPFDKFWDPIFLVNSCWCFIGWHWFYARSAQMNLRASICLSMSRF